MSKIVSLSGQPLDAPATTPAPATADAPKTVKVRFPRLDPGTAQRIGKAYAKLSQLSEQKIATPSSDREIQSLKAYLSATLPNYGMELVSCWFTIQNEYAPLVRALGSLLGRVGALDTTGEPSAPSTEVTGELPVETERAPDPLPETPATT